MNIIGNILNIPTMKNTPYFEISRKAHNKIKIPKQKSKIKAKNKLK